MNWPSLDDWNRFANAIYLLAVGLAAVASVAIYQISIRLSAQKDAEFAEFRINSEASIAAANIAAAQASERAAFLEKEAEASRLAQEQLKASLAWRTISQKQADELRRVASQAPSSLNLRYTDGDPEALFLAIQIGNVLQSAGWNIAPGSVKFQNALTFATHIEGQDGPSLDTLKSALNAGSIPFTTQPAPPAGGMFNVSEIQGAITLTIGSKPPPAQ